MIEHNLLVQHRTCTHLQPCTTLYGNTGNRRLQDFAKTSRRPVTPLGPDLWQNTLDSVADGSLDGVLYDTYPLSKEEQVLESCIYFLLFY